MFAVRLGVRNAPPAAYFHTCPLAVTECMRSGFSIGNVGSTVATGIDNAPLTAPCEEVLNGKALLPTSPKSTACVEPRPRLLECSTSPCVTPSDTLLADLLLLERALCEEAPPQGAGMRHLRRVLTDLKAVSRVSSTVPFVFQSPPSHPMFLQK